MKNIKKNIIRISVLCSSTLMGVSCSEFLDIDAPKTEIVSQSVFATEESATSAIGGIYSLMMTNSSFTNAGMEELTGIASDELINYANRPEQIQFYQNTLSSRNSVVLQVFWTEGYKYISNANGILEGIDASTGLSAEARKRLEGEAKFIRAFSHFYLTSLFGDIPYLTSTDYMINQKAGRMAVADVNDQLIKDLLDASALLNEQYSASNAERVAPNKSAANALLARVYLYNNEWAKAEEAATSVISNTTRYHLVELNQVFLRQSEETIWQLKPVVPGSNTQQARLFTLTEAPNAFSRRVSLQENLVTSFEPSDARMEWIGEFSDEDGTWYFPSKYKVVSSTDVTEYNVVLRLAEQYLIRAEARARQNNFSGAQDDLNTIRTRAGLDEVVINNQQALLMAIEQERRHELFGEWGHRWLYLKRSENLDQVMSMAKPNWSNLHRLFPIPESERLLNPNLSQNPGY